MMLYPAMKDLLKHVPSRYELVNVVACRARRIAREAELEGEPLQEKPVSIAIQEVADGKLEAEAAQQENQTENEQV
ncbi:DNA-directed RNA polymerase subunit omega [Lawsonibacter sp. LCP25S3_G6]|uniref:DNA-directed RNA polymerase subunit omega n=1 Tax=unclassified Lawsonibacter TaxID=2617946 RepID=UPI003F9CB121